MSGRSGGEFPDPFDTLRLQEQGTSRANILGRGYFERLFDKLRSSEPIDSAYDSALKRFASGLRQSFHTRRSFLKTALVAGAGAGAVYTAANQFGGEVLTWVSRLLKNHTAESLQGDLEKDYDLQFPGSYTPESIIFLSGNLDASPQVFKNAIKDTTIDHVQVYNTAAFQQMPPALAASNIAELDISDDMVSIGQKNFTEGFGLFVNKLATIALRRIARAKGNQNYWQDDFEARVLSNRNNLIYRDFLVEATAEVSAEIDSIENGSAPEDPNILSQYNQLYSTLVSFSQEPYGATSFLSLASSIYVQGKDAFLGYFSVLSGDSLGNSFPSDFYNYMRENVFEGKEYQLSTENSTR